MTQSSQTEPDRSSQTKTDPDRNSQTKTDSDRPRQTQTDSCPYTSLGDQLRCCKDGSLPLGLGWVRF